MYALLYSWNALSICIHFVYSYTKYIYYIHYKYIIGNAEGQKERQSTPLSPLISFFENINNLPISDETVKYNIKGQNYDLISVLVNNPPIVTTDVLNKYFEYLFELWVIVVVYYYEYI